ncbi:hypothetical protein COCNU_07G004670 [Cocos nucifera]|uniref:Uncharacterized protein n=1 Tax=Cocos nucifera TaxID=13894 RepID=A0A8K0IEC8_COCNU|nr:hypothetical protein COCNU_07G004670 [Cocos nucifera]
MHDLWMLQRTVEYQILEARMSLDAWNPVALRALVFELLQVKLHLKALLC